MATSVADGDKTANLLLTSPSLSQGSISPINNGLVNDGATEWVFYQDRYLYALTYNQGNAGTTRSYVLGSDGQMRARSAEYKVSRFTSFGKFGDYLIASSTGDGPTAFADAEGHLPQMLLLTYLDVKAETATSNDTNNRSTAASPAGAQPCLSSAQRQLGWSRDAHSGLPGRSARCHAPLDRLLPLDPSPHSQGQLPPAAWSLNFSAGNR